MLTTLLRALSVLLFAGFAFMIGAVNYATANGRTTTTPEPEADEIDLVATFGPLEYTSTANAFRGGCNDVCNLDEGLTDYFTRKVIATGNLKFPRSSYP